MNNHIKFTLPEMQPGQTDWKLWREYQSPIGRDPWPWHHRLIWKVLMYFHERAERLWHWIWDIAQPFQQPRMKYETMYQEIEVLNAADGTLTVESGLELESGEHLIRRPVPPIDKLLESDLTE